MMKRNHCLLIIKKNMKATFGGNDRNNIIVRNKYKYKIMML